MLTTLKQPIELGYWNIKGLLEPSRWICNHFNIDFVEWHPKSQADWEEKAKKLGLFPSMPFLIDGDVVITETTKLPRAIPQYLIEKTGRSDFLGNTPKERAQLRMIEGVLDDIRMECFRIVEMGPGVDHAAAVRSFFDKSGPTYQKIRALSEFLGDKEFFFGYLTWVDFMMQFTARFTGAMCYSLLGYSPYADFPNIVKHLITVTSLSGIKERLDFAQPLPYLQPSSVPFHLLNFREMIDAGLKPI